MSTGAPPSNLQSEGRHVVIGAGFAGLALARRLATSNRDVWLISSPQSTAASRAAIGICAIKGLIHPESPMFSAKVDGFRNLKGWIDGICSETGSSIQHGFSGVSEPFWSAKEYEGIRRRVYHRVFTGGYRCLVRHGGEGLSPYLPASPLGSFFYGDDGWVDPIGLLKGLELSLKGLPRIRAHVEEIQWDSRASHWEVRCEGDSIKSHHVFLAAGIHTPDLIKNATGLRIPHRKVFGTSLFTNKNNYLNGNGESFASVVRGRGLLQFGSSLRYGSDSCLDSLRNSVQQDFTAGVSWSASSGERLLINDRQPLLGPLRVPGAERPLWVLSGLYKSGLQLADLFAQKLVKTFDVMGNRDLQNFEVPPFFPGRFWNE